MENNTVTETLPCGHKYCFDCIQTWIKSRKDCIFKCFRPRGKQLLYDSLQRVYRIIDSAPDVEEDPDGQETTASCRNDIKMYRGGLLQRYSDDDTDDEAEEEVENQEAEPPEDAQEEQEEQAGEPEEKEGQKPQGEKQLLHTRKRARALCALPRP